MTARKPKQGNVETEAEPIEEPSDAAPDADAKEQDDDAALEAELVDASELPDAPIDDAAIAIDKPLPPLRKGPGKSTLLARYDPLEAYMRDVQRYRLLTAEEEHAAAVQYFK